MRLPSVELCDGLYLRSLNCLTQNLEGTDTDITLSENHTVNMAINTILVLIITNLILGIAFAVGHHLFYASLNGEIVGSPSQQEWYLRIGTGLSFLVRALLSASIGSAYIQLLWYSVKSTATSLKGVDALLGVLHNVWDLAVWELWRTRPILTTVALAIWYDSSARIGMRL